MIRKCVNGSMIQVRNFRGTKIPNIDMASLLRSSISAVDAQKKENIEKEEQRKARTEAHAKKMGVKAPKKVLITNHLNNKYKSKFRVPLNPGQIAEVNGFFNNTEVRLEWTTFKFLDIPGERERMEKEKQMVEKTEEELDQESGTKKVNKPFDRSDGLPEILFIGKANVGKSTLLNSLLTESYLKKTKEFAFASKTAGFTPSMNCFNIGKRFRLIDTPGYGIRGTIQQGKQVMEYLQKRKELRRVYLLVSAAEEFTDDDFNIIQFLIEVGVPFEIVFTKADKLKTPKVVDNILKESGVLEIPSEPALIFTNSETNKKFPDRGGLSDLRSSIFEACDLKPGTHPLKMIKN